VKYKPLRGSSYIPLINWICSKRACVNVKNRDNRCFEYAVLLSKYYPGKKSERAAHYKPYLKEPNMEGITRHVEIDELDRFEKLNSTIGVNIFCLEKEEVVPRRICKFRDREIVDLLLISCPEKEHYV
jgi:hypothetical protein